MTVKRKSFRDNIRDNLGGMDPMFVSVAQASAFLNICPRNVYELMATDRIKAVKSGRATLILFESVKGYGASLLERNKADLTPMRRSATA